MTRLGEGKNTIFGSQILLGLLLLASPWLIGFAAEQMAAWSAWITGAAIAVVAALALGVAGWSQAAAWVNLVLGVWTLFAPWLLGFAALSGAMWSHVVLGALVALSAAAELWIEHQSPPRVHA
jgi:hypothetical protein